MRLTRRHCLGCAGALLLAACGVDEKAAAAAGPADIDGSTACELDGMLLADYAGPKAQIHYADAARAEFCCDTVEMFSRLLRPEQQRRVRAVYVQDTARVDWEQPRGHWFDARAGFYAVGSRRRGSMGPTFASFRRREDALDFVAQWGGRVLAFAEVTPELADLSGGALNDARM